MKMHYSPLSLTFACILGLSACGGDSNSTSSSPSLSNGARPDENSSITLADYFNEDGLIKSFSVEENISENY